MKTSKQKRTLREFLKLKSAIDLLDNTEQSVDFEDKMDLGSFNARLQLFSKPFETERENERKRIRKELGIDLTKQETVTQLLLSEENNRIEEFCKKPLDKVYEIEEVPIFTKELLKKWNESAKDKKDKKFDPPIIFYTLIADFMNEKSN